MKYTATHHHHHFPNEGSVGVDDIVYNYINDNEGLPNAVSLFCFSTQIVFVINN